MAPDRHDRKGGKCIVMTRCKVRMRLFLMALADHRAARASKVVREADEYRAPHSGH
jgi:hypothetical protein